MRFAVAAGAAAAAAVVNGLLWPDFGLRYPLIAFYPAILITAWLGGLWPGITCTVLSSTVTAFVWLNPRNSIRVTRASDAVALLVFMAVGAIMSLLSDVSRKRVEQERASRQRAEAAEREVANELADLRRLQRLTVTVFRRDDHAQILRDVLHTACDLLSTPTAYVHLADESGHVLTLAAEAGLPSDPDDRIARVSPVSGPIGEAFLRRERVFAPAAMVVASEPGRLQATPMITADGRILGVLTTHSAANDPADRRLRYLDACVQQTAQALERSLLLRSERTARRNAEHVNRLKDHFLSTVSHELRTPLNAVLGWADMLRTGRLAVQRRERAVEAICDNARRQVRLIDDLLDMSRITSGKLRIEPVDLDILTVLTDAVEVVESAARAKHIEVTVESPHVVCRGDPTRLQQVVWNLLSNAVKFTPEGGSIHVRVREERVAAEIAVTDTGIGIAPDFLPFVFEPFRQADASTTRTQDGLGLGLAIVKKLVEAHGGTIRAESDGPGQGSTFTVRLPLAASSVLPRAHPDVRDAPSLSGIRALIVDDDRDSGEVMATSLIDAGATVYVTQSAAEALESLQREHVHILLADIAMPGQDGYSLVRQIRASTSDGLAGLPAIAITSLVREEDRRAALTAGFHAHLAKPIAPSRLVEAVADVLHRPPGRAPVRKN